MVYFIHMHFIFIYSKVMKNFTSLMLRLLLRIHQSSKFSLQWLISSNPTQRSIMEISYHRKNDFKFRRLYIRDVLEMTNDNLCWHISTCGVNFEGDISLSASNTTLLTLLDRNYHQAHFPSLANSKLSFIHPSIRNWV